MVLKTRLATGLCAAALLFCGPVQSATGSKPTTVNNPFTPSIENSLMHALPLFYHDIVQFDIAQHGSLSFPEQPDNYEFTDKANVIPLAVQELALSIGHYPLVFIPGQGKESPTLVAVVGIGDNLNRFLTANKQWRPNTYIPAYVRQYPFIAIRNDANQDILLGIDNNPDWIKRSGGQSFIDANGKHMPRLEHTLAFAREYLAFNERTRAMAQALQAAGVLEEGHLNFNPPDGGEVREVNGFLIVNEAKLKALPDAELLKLHHADALGLAYAQLLSMGNLQNVLARPDNLNLPAEVTQKSTQPNAGSKQKYKSGKKTSF
jgi:hypothetical protein